MQPIRFEKKTTDGIDAVLVFSDLVLKDGGLTGTLTHTVNATKQTLKGLITVKGVTKPGEYVKTIEVKPPAVYVFSLTGRI